MLWAIGAIVLAIWFTLTFLFHKTGMVHSLLLCAIGLFVIQFVQDRRTKAYKSGR